MQWALTDRLGVISVHIAEDFKEFQFLQWNGPNGELVVDVDFCNQFALAKRGRVGQYCWVILPNIYTGWWIKTRQRQLFSHCLPSICDIGPFLAPLPRTLSSIACDLFFTCFSPPSLFLSGMNQCVIQSVFWCAISLILSWCSISICVVIVNQ